MESQKSENPRNDLQVCCKTWGDYVSFGPQSEMCWNKLMCTFWPFKAIQITQRQSTTVSLEEIGDNIRDLGCDLGQQGSAIRWKLPRQHGQNVHCAFVSLSATCAGGIGSFSKILFLLFRDKTWQSVWRGSLRISVFCFFPWLVWLSGLSAGLWTQWLLVWFPVRAHAWVLGQSLSRGHVRGNHTLMSLSLSFSLPSPLSKNK